MKKSIVSLALFLILGLCITTVSSKKRYIVPTESQNPTDRALLEKTIHEFYTQWITYSFADLEQFALKENTPIKELHEAALTHQKEYETWHATLKATGRKPSKKFITLFEEVRAEFGITDLELSTVDEVSVIELVENMVFINENTLKTYANSHIRFLFAKEFAKRKNSKPAIIYGIQKELAQYKDKNHPYICYYRLLDIQASILAATKSKEYAQAFLSYCIDQNVDTDKDPYIHMKDLKPISQEICDHFDQTPEHIPFGSQLLSAVVTGNEKDIMKWIQKQEALLWQEFEKKGLSKTSFDKRRNWYITNLPQPMPNGTLSDEIKTVVDEVLKDFALDPEIILYIPTKGDDIAFAVDGALYINEQLFNELSPAARKALIGHEVQHLKFYDSATLTMLDKQIKEECPGNAELLDIMNRFIEMRADVCMAIKNKEYAQGSHESIMHMIKTMGENKISTHPSKADRLLMANIVLHESTKTA